MKDNPTCKQKNLRLWPTSGEEERAVALVLFGVILIATCNRALTNLFERVAIMGFSPIDWIKQTTHPQWYPGNWPSGIALFQTSLSMRIQLWLHQLFGFSPEAIFLATVVTEIIFLGISLYLIARYFLDNSSYLLPLFPVALFLLTDFRSINTARFGQPFFYGQFYNFAEGLGWLGLLATLKNRLNWAAILLALAIAVHPLLGGLATLFALCAYLVQGKAIFVKNNLRPILLFALIAGGWLIVVFSNGHHDPVISDSLWFRWARFGNVHWFPVAYGIFTTFHDQYVIPLLVLCITFALALAKSEKKDSEKILLACIVLTGVLTIVGVLFSALDIMPILTKLSLQRASILMISALIFLYVSCLNEVLEKGPFFLLPLLGFAIAAPLVFAPHWSAVPMIAGFFAVVLQAWFAANRRLAIRKTIIFVASVGLLCAVLTLYSLHVGAPSLWTLCLQYYHNASSSFVWLLRALAATAVLVPVWVWWRPAKSPTILTQLAMVSALLLGIYGWQTLPQRRYLWAADFLQAQLWARQGTAPGSMFMLDPMMYDGWRDFSERPSIGSIREWTHTTWMYTGSKPLFEAGLAHANMFEVPVEPYLDKSSSATSAMGKYYVATRTAYYLWDDTKRAEVVRKYGIDYFILDPNLMARHHTRTDLPVVFHNTYYLIVDARPLREKATPPSKIKGSDL